MKSTLKITAEIAATELKLATLKADLKVAKKAEAEAEYEAVFAKIKSAGLTAADLDSFIASRQS